MGSIDTVSLAYQEVVDATASPAASTATAPVSGTAGDTGQVFGGEILTVDVVALPQDAYSAIIPQNIDVATSLVNILISVPGIYFTEGAVSHTRFGDNIYGFPRIAVIEPAETSLVALFVKHLYHGNYFCGKVSQYRRRVIAKERLAVYQYPTHLLPLGLHPSILYGNTRHFLYKVFCTGIRGRFEGGSVILRGIIDLGGG